MGNETNSSLIDAFKVFHKLLLEWEPAVGLPRMPFWVQNQPVQYNSVDYHEVVTEFGNYDPCFVAFHRDAVDTLLPYDLRYESISWHYSNNVVALRSVILYPRHVLRFNSLIAENSEHNYGYPRRTFALEIYSAVTMVREMVRNFGPPEWEACMKLCGWNFCEPDASELFAGRADKWFGNGMWWMRILNVSAKKDFDYSLPFSNPRAIEHCISDVQGPSQDFWGKIKTGW